MKQISRLLIFIISLYLWPAAMSNAQQPIPVPKFNKPKVSTPNLPKNNKKKSKPAGTSTENKINVKDVSDFNGYPYVDLGLPSGVKWAMANVRATEPEEFGNFFAWNETAPKNQYDNNNYDYHTYKNINNITRNSAHDAARHNMGGSWRLPTTKEWNELVINCTWEWCESKGVKGIKGTGKNGNSIFFPAAGKMQGNAYHAEKGKQGYYMGAQRGLDVFMYIGLFFFSKSNQPSIVKTSNGQINSISSTQMIDGKVKIPDAYSIDITQYRIYEGVSVRGVSD